MCAEGFIALPKYKNLTESGLFQQPGNARAALAASPTMHRDAFFRRDRRGVLNNSCKFRPCNAQAFEQRGIPSSLFVKCAHHGALLVGEQGQIVRSGNMSLLEFAW